jgi:hypothetical protein
VALLLSIWRFLGGIWQWRVACAAAAALLSCGRWGACFFDGISAILSNVCQLFYPVMVSFIVPVILHQQSYGINYFTVSISSDKKQTFIWRTQISPEHKKTIRRI